MKRHFHAQPILTRAYCDTCEQELIPTGKFEMNGQDVKVVHQCRCETPTLLDEKYPTVGYRQLEEITSSMTWSTGSALIKKDG